MKFKTLIWETDPYKIDGKTYNAISFCQTWRPKPHKPKSYKYVSSTGLLKPCSSFDSGTITIYKNSRNDFVAHMYHDGCFYPYYVKFLPTNF